MAEGTADRDRHRTGALDLRVGVEAGGPVPPALAWQRYDRLRLWPRWSPQLRAVQPDHGDVATARLAAGATGRVRGPLRLSARFAVLEVDEQARCWSWQVRRGPVRVHLEHGIEPRPGAGGSRAWLVLRGPAPLVLGYLPVAWLALHRLVTLPPDEDEDEGVSGPR